MSIVDDKKIIEAYVASKMWPLGKAKLIGSAATGRMYVRNHDIDVLLFTDINNKRIITDYIDSFIVEWNDLFSLPMDLWVYGDFSESYHEGYKNKQFKASILYTVRFDRRSKRIWRHLKIVVMKFLLSLWRELRY